MTSELYRQIGQLKVELGWVKKSPYQFANINRNKQKLQRGVTERIMDETLWRLAK